MYAHCVQQLLLLQVFENASHSQNFSFQPFNCFYTECIQFYSSKKNLTIISNCNVMCIFHGTFKDSDTERTA